MWQRRLVQGLSPLPAWERLRFGHGGCAEAGSGCTGGLRVLFKPRVIPCSGGGTAAPGKPFPVGESVRRMPLAKGGALLSWELFDRLRKERFVEEGCFRKERGQAFFFFCFFLLLSATKYTTIILNKALNLLKICALCQMLFLGFTGIFRELFVGGKVHKFNR